MPTFAQQAQANIARTGGVGAQLQMGRDKIAMAQFAAQQAAAQRARDYASQQDMARMTLDRERMAAQQSQFEAGQGLQRERMGIQQGQFGQEFELRQGEAGRAQQLQEMDIMERQREMGVDTALGAMYGATAEEGELNAFRQTPEAKYIVGLVNSGQIDPSTGSMMMDRARQSYKDLGGELTVDGGEGGLFAGTGFDQQTVNFVYQDELRKTPGDPIGAQQRAIDRVREGRIRTYRDIDTGQQIVERGQPIFGGGAPLPVGGAQAPTPPPAPTAPPQQPSANLYARAPGATGLIATGEEILGNLFNLAPFIDTELGADVTEIKSEMNVHQQQLLAGLANNPRYPVGEREAIQKALDIDPKAFKSGNKLQAAMRGTDRALRDRLSEAERLSVDMTQPVEVRQSAKQMINNLSTYLRALNVPQEGVVGGGYPSDIQQILDLYPGQ